MATSLITTQLLAGAGEEEEDEDDEEMPQFLQDQRRLLVTKCQQKGWSPRRMGRADLSEKLRYSV